MSKSKEYSKKKERKEKENHQNSNPATFKKKNKFMF